MLLLSDANIFIDLERVGLLVEFSKLDIEISTSDFVFNELNQKQQLLVESLKIDIHTLDSEELMTFFTQYQALGQVKISSQDYSIYYFAKKYNAYLLSNDKALRKFSNKNNIEVKGIFYILDLIIEQSSLSHTDLYTAIEKLLNNSWLPKDEINKRLERLQ
jgi:predicted nucleic acid-binding protein